MDGRGVVQQAAQPLGAAWGALRGALVVAAVAGSALVAPAWSAALAAEATPVSAACDGLRRPLGEVRALAAEGGTDDAGYPTLPPAGVSAEAAVRSEVEGVVGAWVACGNAGDGLALFGLYTDAFIRRMGPITDDAAAAIATPSPAAVGSGAVLAAPLDVRALPDGRASAVVVLDSGANASARTAVFLFAREDGRWRIDDIVTQVERNGDVIDVAAALGTPIAAP